MLVKAMTVGEIISNSLSLFRRQFKNYFTVAAIGGAVYSVFHMAILVSINDKNALACLASLVSIFVLVQAVKIAARQITGDLGHIAASRLTVGKWLAVLLIYFIFGMFAATAIVGFLLKPLLGVAILVLAVYLCVRWCLFMPIMVIEGQGALRALARSWQLVKSNWWRCLWITVLVLLLMGILGLVVSVVLSLLMGGIVLVGALFGVFKDATGVVNDAGAIVGTLVSLVFCPLWSVAFTLMYYDLRVRKENFTMEQSVEAVGENGAANTTDNHITIDG